ncbi:MAG: Lrp/AsnC ligand binding domain-containing protein [Candidatus Nezhaarchaeales archaeon]
MVKACIAIKAVPTKVDSILKELNGLKEVKKAYNVYGRFDIVALIEAADNRAIAELSGKINSMDGVRSTETFVEA